VSQTLLEDVDEAVDGAWERKARQIGEVVRAQSRPKALLA